MSLFEKITLDAGNCQTALSLFAHQKNPNLENYPAKYNTPIRNGTVNTIRMVVKFFSILQSQNLFETINKEFYKKKFGKEKWIWFTYW